MFLLFQKEADDDDNIDEDDNDDDDNIDVRQTADTGHRLLLQHHRQ